MQVKGVCPDVTHLRPPLESGDRQPVAPHTRADRSHRIDSSSRMTAAPAATEASVSPRSSNASPIPVRTRSHLVASPFVLTTRSARSPRAAKQVSISLATGNNHRRRAREAVPSQLNRHGVPDRPGAAAPQSPGRLSRDDAPPKPLSSSALSDLRSRDAWRHRMLGRPGALSRHTGSGTITHS